jgi:glycosyltransferase involved in cell wall biosynthesis
MQQLANVNCVKVVLCQAYDHIFETLEAGMTWMDYRFNNCITVSDTLHEFIKSYFPSVKVDTVSPFIAEEFQKIQLPQKPVVGIHTRDQRDAMKIIKAFYLKYPQFRFVTFRDLRGLSRAEFAHSLKECCLAVWVDKDAALGTFPLEAMKCGVPVVATIPERIPEWMGDNGFWVGETYEIVDVISKYLQNWLEDTVPAELYNEMDQTVAKYSKEQTARQIRETINLYLLKRKEALTEALTKLKEEVTQ